MSEYELWNEIGNLYFLSGSYEPAIQAYTRAIELDGNFGRPYSNLALAYVQKGQYERAIELYLRSIELLVDTREKAISWNRLGNVYRQLRDYSKAVTAYREADESYPETRDERDQPGRDADTPLMISIPALNLSPTTGQVSMETKASAVSLSGRQQVATQIKVIPLLTEPPPSKVENVREAEVYTLDRQILVNESEDFGDNVFHSEEDICVDSLDESLLPQEDDWFPLLLENQEFSHPDLDDMAILPEQVIDEEKPTLSANLEEPGTGIVKIVDVSIPGELFCKEREMATTQPVEMDSNPRKEYDLDNPSSVPTIENKLSLNSPNNSGINATIPDLSLPADTSPFVVVVVCRHKADSNLLPEEKHDTQETENNDFNKIIELDPHDAMAWDVLGSLYKTNGQYQNALFAYEQAISIETNNASFHYHLGLVYAAVNRNEDALRLFKKVINLDPNYGLAHATLSNYYRRMGLGELARRHLNKALNNTFQNENEYNRACLESICGNADRALEYLELALQNQQSYADWALHDPDLEFVRNDPRFMTLIARYTTTVKIDEEKRYEKVQLDCR